MLLLVHHYFFGFDFVLFLPSSAFFSYRAAIRGAGDRERRLSDRSL